jgi:NADH-quinone oxidoreductase subunit M
MIQKVFYGDVNDTTTTVTDIRWNQRLVLLVIGVIIFVTGVYPKLLVHITQSAVTAFITR